MNKCKVCNHWVLEKGEEEVSLFYITQEVCRCTQWLKGKEIWVF